jgi:hypothetical protein
MDRIDRKVIEDKNNRNRLVVVTWFDPYDDSDEVTIGELKITKAYYRTSGYLMGIDNDHAVLGYNQEYDHDEKPTGTYKGYGAIPMPLITNVEIMDRNK